MNLDKNQQKLYNHDFTKQSKNAICLVAGAGSGKTTTIVHTIVKLINSGYHPKHFFITTFTRAAAVELKERLKLFLTEEQVNQIIVGTFHEIAGYFLDKYKKEDDSLISSFDDCLHNYTKLLNSDEYIEEHKYIFIDEYQDINDIQETIISTLYNKANILVVIGDDQQNIYTFRGSNINNMLNFINKYNGQYIYLTTNYRCPTNVVTMSNSILKYNKNKIDKHFNSNQTNNSKIILLSLKVNEHDIDSYNYHVSKMVLKKILYLSKINSSNKKETLTVISRYNYTLKYLETMLTRYNIKSCHQSINNLNKDKESDTSNRIILSSIHGTKGLEFDHVILIDFIPNKCLNMNELEEERRLFYVAITRAKKELTVIYNINNPSCFLRECLTEDATIFMNLPKDHIKFIPEYNFFKKNYFIQYNIDLICKNLTFETISDLDKICPFRSWLNTNNKKIKIIKLHDSIQKQLDDIVIDLQPITCFEHIYESIYKLIIIREIYIKFDTNINLDPIQAIIFNTYGLIKNSKDISTIVEEINKIYNIIIDIPLEYLKKYSIYSNKVCPKYLEWTNLIDPKNIDKFTKSINNYYNKSLPWTTIIDDLLNTCIVNDMTVNNRLSIQYLDIKNNILKKICNNFKCVDKLIEEISLLAADIKTNEIITFNEFSGKADFICAKKDKSELLHIVIGDKLDINIFIYQLTLAIIYNLDKSEELKIKLLKLYIPFSGQIYRINIDNISLKTSMSFLNKILNV